MGQLLRQCKSCNSTSTSSSWYRIEDGHLCKKCYSHLIGNPRRNRDYIKKYNDRRKKGFNNKYNEKRMWFKNKSINLPENPRTGVCNFCRAVAGIDCAKTEIHHERYDANNPLKAAIEICTACHTRRSHELGQLTA